MSNREDRERIADLIGSALDRHGPFGQVKIDGDRITLLADDGEMAVEIVVAVSRPIATIPLDVCPFCGGKRLQVSEGDKTFLPRRGCLDCDRWIESVKVRR